MRRHVINALGLLLLSALVASCNVNDAIVPCDTQLILKFNTDRLQDQTFLNNIRNVDVYLFDENRNYLESKTIGLDELRATQGTTFDVPPGKYHVVSWANGTTEKSLLPRMTRESKLETSFVSINGTDTGDPIYYAPYKTPGVLDLEGGTRAAGDVDYSIYATEVTASGANTMDLSFADAHRRVMVYVAGYEYSSWYDGKPVLIEDCDASNRYSFLLEADPTPVGLRQDGVITDTPAGDMYYAEFYSAIIPLSEMMGICLYQPTTGEELLTIHFDDWLKEQDLTDDMDIEVQITFLSDTNITVTLPSWKDNSVESM